MFSAPYHFHPECELTLILTGSGKRYVGDTMENYFPGDLVLLGSNVAHCWKTSETSKEESSSIVLHFKSEFMGKDFFFKPEMNRILKLLDKSSSGIHFLDNIEATKERMILLVKEKESYKKLVMLLDILHHLSANHKYDILLKKKSYAILPVAEHERISKVIAYIVDNFTERIFLKEAATLANMATHSFCKYFKRITRKTFIEMVNDYRIDFAVKQLNQTDKPVSQICFDCGFNEISNFHKTFKDRVKLSPLKYRNTFMEKLS
ncbi:MAG: AraC family transcriptional regulator [Bacteroidota bacterium]|nr:AraC family transcriptional regulator [Bacteroidota bacterium]